LLGILALSTQIKEHQNQDNKKKDFISHAVCAYMEKIHQLHGLHLQLASFQTPNPLMMAIQSRGKLWMVEPSNLFAGTISTVKNRGK